MSESVVIFSGKGLATFKLEGGLAWWRISAQRAKALEYAVVTRCLTKDWATPDVEQGTALMICKLNGQSVQAENGRICLQFDAFAPINVAQFWQQLTNNQRNPFTYRQTDELLKMLGLQADKIQWQPFETTL